MIAVECPYCQKKIEGYKESQAKFLMNIHIMSKHPGGEPLDTGNKDGNIDNDGCSDDD